MVRPPRQTCHRKGSGANRYNRNDRHNRQQVRDKEKASAASEEGQARDEVYRKVSFNSGNLRSSRENPSLPEHPIRPKLCAWSLLRFVSCIWLYTLNV